MLGFWKCSNLQATSGFSLVGPTFQADFGEKTFNLKYERMDRLILTEVKGPTVGRRQVLMVKIVELRPRLFMVNWQEANKLSVTDIEDYENGVVYANLTTPSNSFIQLKGSLKEIR
jgi:hypothetical protein